MAHSSRLLGKSLLGKKKKNPGKRTKRKQREKKAKDAAKTSVIKWSRGDLECGAEHGVLESGAAPQGSVFVAWMVQASKLCVTKGQKSLLEREGWGVMCRGECKESGKGDPLTSYSDIWVLLLFLPLPLLSVCVPNLFFHISPSLHPGISWAWQAQLLSLWVIVAASF